MWIIKRNNRDFEKTLHRLKITKVPLSLSKSNTKKHNLSMNGSPRLNTQGSDVGDKFAIVTEPQIASTGANFNAGGSRT